MSTMYLALVLIATAVAAWDGRRPAPYLLASLLLGPAIVLALIYGTYETPDGHLHQIDLFKGRGFKPLSR
jgi:hypothetical protein